MNRIGVVLCTVHYYWGFTNNMQNLFPMLIGHCASGFCLASIWYSWGSDYSLPTQLCHSGSEELRYRWQDTEFSLNALGGSFSADIHNYTVSCKTNGHGTTIACYATSTLLPWPCLKDWQVQRTNHRCLQQFTLTSAAEVQHICSANVTLGYKT